MAYILIILSFFKYGVGGVWGHAHKVPSRLLASMYTQGCLLSRIFSGLPRFARNDGVDVSMLYYTAMA